MSFTFTALTRNANIFGSFFRSLDIYFSFWSRLLVRLRVSKCIEWGSFGSLVTISRQCNPNPPLCVYKWTGVIAKGAACLTVLSCPIYALNGSCAFNPPPPLSPAFISPSITSGPFVWLGNGGLAGRRVCLNPTDQWHTEQHGAAAGAHWRQTERQSERKQGV